MSRTKSRAFTIIVLLALSASLAPSVAADAPSAPYATTGGSSGYSVNKALSGTLNDANQPGTYYFDYGLSAAYGQSSTPASVPASPADQPVSSTINAYQFGSTYHYRLALTTSSGTVYGSDATFTTPDYHGGPGLIPPGPNPYPTGPYGPTGPAVGPGQPRSAGPRFGACAVPAVRADSVARARQVLLRARCTLRRVTYGPRSRSCRRPHVISQAPAAGAKAPLGRVDLRLCRMPRTSSGPTR